MARKVILSRQARLTGSLISGLIVGVAIFLYFGEWLTSALVGWDAFAVVLVGLIWFDFMAHDGDETAKVARRDDVGGFAVDALVITACVASLAAVGALLLRHNASAGQVAFGLVSVILSWLTVQTLYTLRYAALYYRTPEGGVDFNSTERPRYSDFAYLAFTIGMTYQVADTNLTHHSMRRAALVQSLVSFVFGVAIIATTINAMISFAGTI